MRTLRLACAAAALSISAAAPAVAEVIEASEGHFITRNEAVVEAGLTETWLALISPARWWSSEHTWSADAANLTLTPQAGGCFCEKIPEVSEPDRFTLEGSVEHMRVIQAYPEVALRMSGALGPLQSEPVTGVLTIALSEVEREDGVTGTRIVWEYNVGGQMRYPIPVISNAVDGVMTLQLTRLADELGTIVAPTVPASDPEPEPDTDTIPDEVVEDDEIVIPDSDAPIVIDPEAMLEEALPEEALPEQALDEEPGSDEEVAPEERGPTVDEAFEDLIGPG